METDGQIISRDTANEGGKVAGGKMMNPNPIIDLKLLKEECERFVRNDEIYVQEFALRLPAEALNESKRIFGGFSGDCLEYVSVRMEKTVLSNEAWFDFGYQTGDVNYVTREEIETGKFDHRKTLVYSMLFEQSLNRADSFERMEIVSKSKANHDRSLRLSRILTAQNSQLDLDFKYAPYMFRLDNMMVRHYVISQNDGAFCLCDEEFSRKSIDVLVCALEKQEGPVEADDLFSVDRWNKLPNNSYLHVRTSFCTQEAIETLASKLRQFLTDYLKNPNHFAQLRDSSFEQFYHGSPSAPFPNHCLGKVMVGRETWTMFLAPKNDIIDGGIVDVTPGSLMHWRQGHRRRLLTDLKKAQNEEEIRKYLEEFPCQPMHAVDHKELVQAKATMKDGDDDNSSQLGKLVNKLLMGDEMGVNLAFRVACLPYEYGSYSLGLPVVEWNALSHYAFYPEARYIKRESDRIAHILNGNELFIHAKYHNRLPRMDLPICVRKLPDVIDDICMGNAMTRLLGSSFVSSPASLFDSSRSRLPFVARYTFKLEQSYSNSRGREILVEVMLRRGKNPHSTILKLNDGTITLLAPRRTRIVSIHVLTPSARITDAFLVYYHPSESTTTPNTDSKDVDALAIMYESEVTRYRSLIDSYRHLPEAILATFNLWNHFNQIFDYSRITDPYRDAVALCRLKLIELLASCCEVTIKRDNFYPIIQDLQQALKHLKYATSPNQSEGNSIQAGLHLFSSIQAKLWAHVSSPLLLADYFLNFSWTKTFAYELTMLSDYSTSLSVASPVQGDRLVNLFQISDAVSTSIIEKWVNRQANYYNSAFPSVDFAKVHGGPDAYIPYYYSAMKHVETDAHVSLVGHLFPIGSDVVRLLTLINVPYVLKMDHTRVLAKKLVDYLEQAPVWLQLLVLKLDGEQSIYQSAQTEVRPTSSVGLALANQFAEETDRRWAIYRAILRGELCVRCARQPLREPNFANCNCVQPIYSVVRGSSDSSTSLPSHTNPSKRTVGKHGYCSGCLSIMTEVNNHRQRFGDNLYADAKQRVISNCLLYPGYRLSNLTSPQETTDVQNGGRYYKLIPITDGIMIQPVYCPHLTPSAPIRRTPLSHPIAL